MELRHLERYAPQARIDFIKAVSEKAEKFGLTEKKIADTQETGDVVIINGVSFPRQIVGQRRALIDRIRRDGFQQVMEQVAYTWFNRLVAIRYMEIHGYLEHGYHVLHSDTVDDEPEILQHVTELEDELEFLDFRKALELQDNNDSEALYALILKAQCQELNKVMPFLFEKLDDDTELLLPDNLLHSDSLIRKLVTEVPESSLEEVEAIGWLYQFYISDRKAQLMKAKKAYKKDEIPAVTQLFTPNWIVKYLVQNSIGRQWLMSNPESDLKDEMPFYIEPAEQSEAVQQQLAAMTPEEIDPETIRVLDPACGSGHILVEAYELLKAIYQKCHYNDREIPRLILEKNLFGLDIDERAVQLAGFALMMKARKDNRRIFRLRSSDEPVKLNLHAVGESNAVHPSHLQRFAIDGLDELLDTFHNGKTYGSLLTVPGELTEKLEAMEQQIDECLLSAELFEKPELEALKLLVAQARVLGQKYDAVIANPPYMNKLNPELKNFASRKFSNSKSDLFAMFMEHGFSLIKKEGYNAQVNMQSWMFLSSFEKMREELLTQRTIITMAHFGARAFETISGEVVQTTAWVLGKQHFDQFTPVFFRLIEGDAQEKRQALLERKYQFDHLKQDDFQNISGSPVAYWASKNFLKVFMTGDLLGEQSAPRQGLATSDDERFLRHWFEVDNQRACTAEKEEKKKNAKWFPFVKGGSMRRWYGNNSLLINWESDGADVIHYASSLYGSATRTIKNMAFYFKEMIAWSLISGGIPSFRYQPKGQIFGHKGPGIFSSDELDLQDALAFLNSKVAASLLSFTSPNLSFEVGNIKQIPVLKFPEKTKSIQLTEYTKDDWDSYETSWDFKKLPWIFGNLKDQNTETSYNNWRNHGQQQIAEMIRLEEENNRLFIDAYGLQNELEADVPEHQITLTQNPAYRYPDKKNKTLTSEEREALFKTDSVKELLSYVLGCLMGRYSLDQPGLVYANSGNKGFDASAYATFPADEDGIVPLGDESELAFDQDFSLKLREFLVAVWGEETLSENLSFIADALGRKANETAMDSIRRYMAKDFFKDHLQTYRNRPIYWLFSSGKKKAFEGLVYLHRYNESTLSRMRMEYVVPMQGRLRDQIDQLDRELASADNAARKSQINRKLKLWREKQVELKTFDENLRHYADQKIELDLDQGVKVNYGSFPGLLAEEKKITGKKS
ncbi:BREX-1 system adenine-specific DNA-methyltransferase PglX [Endozoicomonas gorgoniicola]|uniref:site-specific DNA-methyltransferase (adenine-specific) n=1 Tax=Endozoicomonas gorgoniicola TaxID=1234144 RepID=A0ABT3MTZ2_9GAMM|nr:BREX-1 system adenine-specific DNA-methyltransferase PglX [Endozoicomonas gorgoniicola]MCW7552862.1 BREX-1 system adenine-specific DNA-methyltransferase PglX [Endozoicomonas gorgoniicola]